MVGGFQLPASSLQRAGPSDVAASRSRWFCIRAEEPNSLHRRIVILSHRNIASCCPFLGARLVKFVAKPRFLRLQYCTRASYSQGRDHPPLGQCTTESSSEGFSTIFSPFAVACCRKPCYRERGVENNKLILYVWKEA